MLTIGERYVKLNIRELREKMTNTLDFKFIEGQKTVDFSMSGFNDEHSIILVKEIMKVITKSGNEENIEVVEMEPQLEEVKDEQLEEGLKLVDDLIEDDAPEEETPEQINIDDRIALFNSDNETYQAYYICKCGDRGKHRIKRSQIYVNCHNCGKRMRTRDAHMEGFPMKDEYGNSFIAGEYKRSDEVKYGAFI